MPIPLSPVAPHLDHPLRQRVQDGAENRPGIYRFVGPRGELLYVGKSVRVRDRLLSYFRTGPSGKEGELLRVATGVEWEHLPNEFEALLRELRLIRALRPRFNVRHRRERRFTWIRLTHDPAPRLVAAARPAPGAIRTFGPFPASRALPDRLRELSRLCGVRDCSATTPIHFADQLDLLSPPRTPRCARVELGSCPGPCAALCSQAEYGRGVREAVDFLDGRTEAPLERLRQRLARAVEAREYELAARLRDREEGLCALRDQLLEYRGWLDELTLVYRVPAEEGPDRGYLLVRGRVRLSFDEPEPNSPGATRLAHRMNRLIAEPARPPEDVGAGEREELFLTARWFRDRKEEWSRTMPPERYLRTLTPHPPDPGRG